MGCVSSSSNLEPGQILDSISPNGWSASLFLNLSPPPRSPITYLSEVEYSPPRIPIPLSFAHASPTYIKNNNASMLLPSSETPEPVAPFTGALLYPLAEILDLARGIVHNLERHHKILLRAAQEREDDEEEAIQLNNLVDIGLTLCAVDPIQWVQNTAIGAANTLTLFSVRWKESMEEERGGQYDWTPEEVEALTHPRKAEEGLLSLARIPRAEFVRYPIPIICSPNTDILVGDPSSYRKTENQTWNPTLR
jgi:hypothetical protein